MKITELKSFLEIVSLKSFSKAAINLHYAHSSVTAQIKALETHLGERLFLRDNKSVELTEAGKRFYKYARSIVDLSNEAKQMVHELPKLNGKLTIAAVETISTYRLPDILKKFQLSAPDVHIAFKVMRDQEIYDSIKAGTIDIAFTVEEKILIKDVDVFAICKEPVSLYAHPKHPLAHKKTVTAFDLANEHHLLWGPGCSYSNVFSEMMQSSGYHSFAFMEFSNTETMKHCAMSGLGIATLTDITAQKELESNHIAKLNFPIPDKFSSFMLWNTYRSNHPNIQHFLETVKNHCCSE